MAAYDPPPDFQTNQAQTRCPWAAGHPAMLCYQEGGWGVPVHDDRLLFELLTLEGAPATSF